jgi:hypothetical protein
LGGISEQIQRPTLILDPFKVGIRPSCGSFDVLLCVGGRCTDPFHDIAHIAAMEAQFSEPDCPAAVPIYTEDGE